ncbi:MAG TPA: molybdenum cofactor carrier protein [Terriglobia bacterium]|nr:molybdenum cofactor carrier protein [Terriglobia bacterium]
MNPTLSRWTVGVMGSATESHDDDADAVGELLTRLEVNLLTGGGQGVMRSVARSFITHRRGAGISIGILPCASETDRSAPRAGYPNEYVELAVHTHLPRSGNEGTDDLSRNHINILSCAAIIALPGGAGTASELALAERYGKPAMAYSADPARLSRLPASVARSNKIEQIEGFLAGALRRP